MIEFYHFMIKELSEEYEGQFTSLGGDRGGGRETHNFFSSNRKKISQELIKIEKKLQKLYLRDCSLLTTQDLWQAHYQILLIILLKEFIKLNVKFVIHIFMNTETLKII